MAHDAATQIARLKEAILRHIKKHPLAADTAEGILACWVPRTGFEDAPDHIAAALGDMVAKRLLQARGLPDGVVVYGRGDGLDG